MFQLIEYFLWLGLLVFLLSLSQYFNILGMNEVYVQSIAPTQYESLINSYPFPRPVAMIGNPNELGFLFVILSLVCLILLLDECQKGKKLRVFLFFVIFNCGVMLTLSRGSLAALLAGFLIIYGWMFLNSRSVVKIKIIVAIFCVIGFGFLVLNHPLIYEKITWRFMAFLSLSEDASFTTRLYNWNQNIDIIKEHPILGVGPLRGVGFIPADNEWLLLWRSYGLIGIFIFIGLMMSNLFYKCVKEVRAFSIAISFSVFIYMIPVAAFHSLVLFPFLLVWLAIIDTKNMGFFAD
jgi:O-antigen ligase